VKHMPQASQVASCTGGRTRRRGAATVELALVAPLIVFLLFSIIEIGFMVKNRADLGHAAREAARLAAVGATPTRMTEAVNTNLTTIHDENVTPEYQFRSWDEDTQSWGAWTTLGVLDGGNNAAPGDQIRVRLGHDHALILPGIMGPVLNADASGRVNLVASSVMMRE